LCCIVTPAGPGDGPPTAFRAGTPFHRTRVDQPEMPNGQPNQLANLHEPFLPGNKHAGSRRSVKTDRAIKTFRNLTPEAAEYAARVLRDEGESTRYRLQAMEAILRYGMPKNLEELLAKAMGEGARAYMRVEFVRPGDDAVDVNAKPNGHGTFEVSFGAP